MILSSISALGIVLGSMATLSPPPMPENLPVPIAQWEAREGDAFLVDTVENMGYLIHLDGSYTRFPVITGQKRRVYYIGRTYFAATPNRQWQVQSRHIKGDRFTFGPTGRFLRLYRDGEGSTAYGIHEHAAEEVMFARINRYQSMGCVIVQTHVLDIIEDTYTLNQEILNVTTRAGIVGDPAENLRS